jgi:hypothetical protein
MVVVVLAVIVVNMFVVVVVVLALCIGARHMIPSTRASCNNPSTSELTPPSSFRVISSCRRESQPRHHSYTELDEM